MLRFLGVALLVVGLVAVSAADSAWAQGRGRGQGGPGGPGGMFGGGAGGSLFLLMNPQVREQLELSDDQIAKLEDMQADFQAEMRDMFQGGRGGGGADMREKIQEMAADMQKDVDKVLLRHQRDQLAAMQASMTMRRGGASGVLSDPGLVKQLGLSEEEAREFREKAEELRAKQEEEITKLRERYNDRIIALLPKEAQATMREWMKTEVPEFNFGGRGQGGPGGDRGGQRGGQGRGRTLDF